MNRLGSAALAALSALTLASAPHAAEGGATIYLLGSGGPGTAIMPPIEGVFFANTLYYYRGDAGGERELVVGGQVVLGLDATILADFATVLWVPSTDFLGGTVALGVAIPYGVPDVSVSATLTGPRGNTISLRRTDSAFVIGDPIVTGMLGWKNGNWHTQLSTMINVPIGDYREGELANLAFHRWAGDVSFAVSWHDDATGWDVSGKVGFTFNGTNDDTDYTSGTDFHVEAAVEKILAPQWSLGAQAYYYKQVSGDSGEGAVLGPNEGEVTGAGLTAAYNFEVAHNPISLRLHALWEFDATRRLEGNTVFLDLTFPLQLNLPPGAPGG